MQHNDQLAAQIYQVLSAVVALEGADRTVDLIANGVLDSAAFLELFSALEDRYNIAITSADMKLDNFRSIDAITAFVAGKKPESFKASGNV